MRSTIALTLLALILGGCAVVPVGPPVAYGAPRVVVAAAVPAPVVVVRPWYRWYR